MIYKCINSLDSRGIPPVSPNNLTPCSTKTIPPSLNYSVAVNNTFSHHSLSLILIYSSLIKQIPCETRLFLFYLPALEFKLCETWSI